jgi:hypothetical protein
MPPVVLDSIGNFPGGTSDAVQKLIRIPEGRSVTVPKLHRACGVEVGQKRREWDRVAGPAGDSFVFL